MSNVPDLDLFLSLWKDELREKSNDDYSHASSLLLGKRQSNAGSYADFSSEPHVMLKLKKLSESEPAPLLVLPAVEGHTYNSNVIGSRLNNCGEEPCLVDTLISDLNEINTIPFFDVQLPREIALIIFSYLKKKDLCNCSLVSKSWKDLAEDNLLWCKICQDMGYNTSADSQSMTWKKVVKDLTCHERNVESNWKERTCAVSDHQPDNCGVLCCVDYHSGTILSCYSSGAMYTWDVNDGRGPLAVKQMLGLYSTALPTCCSLASGFGVVGSSCGSLSIFDLTTNSKVYSLSDMGVIDSIKISRSTTIAVSSHHLLVNGLVHPTVSVIVTGKDNAWERKTLQLLPDQSGQTVTKVDVLPHPWNTSCPHSIFYSTSTSLVLHPVTSAPIPILTSDGDSGKNFITCSDFNEDTIACGTSAKGYQVQLFDLHSAIFKHSLRGHGQQVSCLDISHSPPNLLASGSADKRVRVFDYRCSHPSLVLSGHSSIVRNVQMDHWKVVSGSYDGTVIVWDQRMAAELWRSHDRHPVEMCRFMDCSLLVGHVPVSKYPQVSTGNPLICHRRFRGLVRVYDFSVDPLHYTSMLPAICSSKYDEPAASFYNLDLKYPYDDIT